MKNKETIDADTISKQTPLERKERAITAGLVVELEPHEAEALGVAGMDELPSDDPELEQDLLDSRFDDCEFDLKNYSIDKKKGR